MGSGWLRLRVYRLAALWAAVGVVVGAFIADATILAYLNSNSINSNPVRAASGWTMFVAVVSLLALPLLLTRVERIQRWVNRTGVELAILGLLTLFFFISGIVLATKSGDHSCVTSGLCSRIRATTAFSWLAFFALLVALTVVGLVARVQSRLGLPLFTAYSFDVEGEEITPPAPNSDMHAAAMSIDGAYYNGPQPVPAEK
ncbi:hypothetical protein GGF46_003436 [Coemansia sp. RSA 552]|nr:hypothetical protein GGF46_003436 [Coemansia sp. RSA 552]